MDIMVSKCDSNTFEMWLQYVCTDFRHGKYLPVRVNIYLLVMVNIILHVIVLYKSGICAWHF